MSATRTDTAAPQKSRTTPRSRSTNVNKTDRKRLAIIHAAIEIINEKSYALATMSEIAASLDLKDGTLYYYFESKQALAYECQTHSLTIFERLLAEADASGEKGLTKVRLFIEGMLHDSELNGPQLYFGDYSYLADDQRELVKAWGDRLTLTLERFLDDGIADGSVVPCEPKIVVELLLGMLIWLAKWVPSIEGMTFERLMDAINLVSLAGLRKTD